MKNILLLCTLIFIVSACEKSNNNYLKSLKNWEDEKKYCSGIDDDTGKLFTFDEINKKIE